MTRKSLTMQHKLQARLLGNTSVHSIHIPTALFSTFPLRGPTYRFVDGVARTGPTSSAISHQDRTPYHHSGLVKQAYSAYVVSDPYNRLQKWHLTAYFTYTDLPHLPTVDHDPVLSRIVVPAGIYRTGKARSRSEEDDSPPSARSSRPPESSPGTPCELPQLPSLSTIQSTTAAPPSGGSPPRLHGQRLPEDQRIIEMLNSRHIR